MNIEKLCILRLSAIGDVCHAAALVERLQRQAPHIQITWVIGKLEYLLVKDIPNINFIVFDKKAGKQAYQDLQSALTHETFDALFVMQVAFRANWAARLIKAKVKVGFDWARSKELHWLFANKRIATQPQAHVLEGFMAFADAIGIPSSESVAWSIPIPADDWQWAKQRCDELGEFAVISPAASKAERNWLPERYAAIADYLSSKGLKVVLCGGPGPLDKHFGEQISQLTHNISDNLIGHTSLKQMLGVLKCAKLVIAPDTGPAHMATTVGTDVIGLYAHSNPLRTGPYNNLADVVSVYEQSITQQTGKPWQNLPWGTRAKGPDLMALITVEQVSLKIDQVLARACA